MIVAIPRLRPRKKYFDPRLVEAAIEQAREHNSTATIVIKSPIPLGFTEALKQKLNDHRLLFLPGFRREGQTLYDNLYLSRIIVVDGFRRSRG